ncbi:DUF4352 domain-containing protein [Streptomyces sp. NPDC005805]|uniref:DUF4352 domain-containing protein n=1 Tax=Streptomyces sp. NPDC005805 TaxID=3157068 RepID=UPI0033C38017
MATALTPALALVLGLTACQADGGPGETAPRDGKRAATTAAPAVAGIGGTADADDRPGGGHLRVTLNGVVDPALGVRATPRPAAGHRWVGVDLSVVNVGGTAYESAVGGGAWVTDERGKKHRAVTTGELTTGFPLTRGALGAGEHRDGWLVFALPHGSRAVSLHWPSGDAEHRWTL